MSTISKLEQKIESTLPGSARDLLSDTRDNGNNTTWMIGQPSEFSELIHPDASGIHRGTFKDSEGNNGDP